MVLVASLLSPAVNSAYEQLIGALNDLGRVVVLGFAGFVGLRIVFWLCGATFDMLFKAPRASTLLAKPVDRVSASNPTSAVIEGRALSRAMPWRACAIAAALIGLIAGALVEHHSYRREPALASRNVAETADARAAYAYTLYLSPKTTYIREYQATFDDAEPDENRGEASNKGQCETMRDIETDFYNARPSSLTVWCEKGLYHP